MIKILEHQAKFIESQKTHTGLVGGFRSGKSHAGVIKTVIKKMQLDCDVAYYLPTYGLIRDVAIPKFEEFLTSQKLPYKLNQTSKDIHIGNKRIILRSMDNPDLIIGYEVGYSCIDEADVLPIRKMKEVMIKVLSRNSAKLKGNNNATDFVSTPEGFNFLYDFFVKNPSENKLLIKARTESNPFISENYIRSLQDQYSHEQLEAYLNGEFVNLTSGTVYKDFDRDINSTNAEIKLYEQLHIGLDFNITQMAAVVLNSKHEAVAEHINVYDTIQMCEILKRDYPNHQILIYPDASGNSRKSAGQSDFDIIKKAGFRIISPNKNPNVRDRVNAVNKFFRDGGKVNVKNCPNLVASLEQQTYKNGEPDKSAGHDHVNDAYGYVVNSLYSKSKTFKIIT
jgi:hypothetical protein